MLDNFFDGIKGRLKDKWISPYDWHRLLVVLTVDWLDGTNVESDRVFNEDERQKEEGVIGEFLTLRQLHQKYFLLFQKLFVRLVNKKVGDGVIYGSAPLSATQFLAVLIFSLELSDKSAVNPENLRFRLVESDDTEALLNQSVEEEFQLPTLLSDSQIKGRGQYPFANSTEFILNDQLFVESFFRLFKRAKT